MLSKVIYAVVYGGLNVLGSFQHDGKIILNSVYGILLIKANLFL